MDVTIITSLFNRLDLTRVYLESLERTLARWRYEVILVDDGSTDGTRKFLARLPETRYRLLLNDAPRGFAANNNAAARLARAPLLCLLNNDTALLPGWLEPMARLARWDRRAALGRQRAARAGERPGRPLRGLLQGRHRPAAARRKKPRLRPARGLSRLAGGHGGVLRRPPRRVRGTGRIRRGVPQRVRGH